MAHRTTVLALSPSTGGTYFGAVLTGLQRELTAAGGQLVLVQTLDPGPSTDAPLGTPTYATPAAWSEVDGAVAITAAVSRSYLQRLRDAGKPVVIASASVDGFVAPLALPDNADGTVAAVEHLIAHGHTRIGFVTIPNHSDIDDRLAAYRRTLAAHGLESGPHLVFVAPQNTTEGGTEAAAAVLRSAAPPSALMIATDRVALGLMNALGNAGLSIPRDIAVLSFDNIAAAAFADPPLSSVNQRFDEVGALAGQLVLAQIRGEAAPSGPYTAPAAGLALRESCGCGPMPDGDRPLAESDLATSVATARASAALWQREAVSFRGQTAGLEDALDEQIAVDQGLRRSSGSEPRLLGWLAGTHVRAGVLALWEDDPSSGRLRVAGCYDRARVLPPLLGTALTADRFPPTPLTAAARPQDGELCIVVPVRTAERDWGLLAVLGAITTTSSRETYHHWAALLCASLESERLEASMRASEERYALAARATNDGLWEWDARSRHVFLSDRCCTLLGLAPDPAGDRLAEWRELVHPDDLAEMRRGMRTTAIGQDESVESEYRVRTADGSYRWMLSRALGVRAGATGGGPVERIVGSLSDIHDRRSLEDKLREHATIDAVTGLPNRRLFLDRLGKAVERWQRDREPFAVLFLDLDGFKVVNDSLGHQMGDRLLIAVGARIQRELRSVDTGARFGGDEFAILLNDVPPAGVLAVAQRVQAALLEVINLDGNEFAIQASLGVATSAIAYTSAEDVLRDADTAMYHAKATERGTVSFFDAAMHAHAVHQLRLHAEIRRGLEESQFEVHYQPIVNLSTGRTDRFEALVRWQHPERGLLLPEDFLPLMDEAGLIVRLGHWIIDEVCRQLAQWGPGVVNVAVNVSDREFWHPDLLPQIQRSLARYDIAADRLTLEITEGVIMRRPEVARRLLGAMHDAGLRLHIDDFGTGYSSLDSLHRFPVDAFKIDRSFIRGLTTGDRKSELVRVIVAMGKALGLAVVAEGVETADQLTFLQQIGCSTGQGFLFMPAVAGDRAPYLLGRVLGIDQTEGDTLQPVR
ncbi:MAG: EAL domain-containing protein [Cellulomonas sp.]